jgi:asparagine synthase (glutamine-hydrolysing)
MAWAGAKPGQLPCYTFGGEYRDCADVRIARRIAGACGQEHRTIRVGREFCEEFPRLAEETVRVSDGAMDVSGAVELYANRTASAIAPTRLTGNYGSEIVRGNVAFGPGSVDPQLPSRDLMRSVETAAATYRLARQCSDLSFIAFKQVPWYHYARLSVELSQLTPRSPFLDNDLVALMFRAPPSLISSRVPTLRAIGNGNPRLLEIPTDRGTWQVAPTPWCRMRSVVNELTVKAEYAWDYGMPAWLTGIDRALAPLRPERLFLGRHKFYHFRVWYRDRLGDYLRDVLLDPRSLARPYLDARRAEEIVRQHLEGRANWTEELHRMLTLELLHRTILEVS